MNFLRNKKVKQDLIISPSFRSCWEIKLKDQAESVDNLWRIKLSKQHELNSFQPNRINKREVVHF